MEEEIQIIEWNHIRCIRKIDNGWDTIRSIEKKQNYSD